MAACEVVGEDVSGGSAHKRDAQYAIAVLAGWPEAKNTKIDTTTANGRLKFGIPAALSEFERELISQRTRAGMDAAKRNGKHVGRPRKLRDQ